MPSATFSVTAANFAIGQDIFSVGTGMGVKQAQSGNGTARKLVKIGVVGSTNPSDAGFDLYAGGKYIGSYMNTTGGANVVPKPDGDIVLLSGEDIVPANVNLVGIVNDPAATNPVTVTLVWEDMPVFGKTFKSDKMVVSGGGSPRRGGYGGGRSYVPRRTTRRR